MLSTLSEKLQRLRQTGVDRCEVLSFTPQLAARIGKMQDIVDDTERELAIMNLPKEEPILRDTLHFEAPKTINLDDIFGSGIEIDEEE